MWQIIKFVCMCCVGVVIGYYVSASRNYNKGRASGFMVAVRIYQESINQMIKDGIMVVDWDRMHKSIRESLEVKAEPLKRDGNVVQFPDLKNDGKDKVH